MEQQMLAHDSGLSPAVGSAAGGVTEGQPARILTPEQLLGLVPGIRLPEWAAEALSEGPSSTTPGRRWDFGGAESEGAENGGARGKEARRKDADLARACAGLQVPCGVVLDVPKYLKALWAACQVNVIQNHCIKMHSLRCDSPLAGGSHLLFCFFLLMHRFGIIEKRPIDL